MIVGCIELTSRWLQAATTLATVPLFWLLDPARSVPWQMLQFLVALVSGASPLCLFLCKTMQCRDLNQLAAQYSTLAHEVRMSSVTAGQWLFIRMWHRLNQWPHLLAVSADPGRPMPVRQQVVTSFSKRRSMTSMPEQGACCAGGGGLRMSLPTSIREPFGCGLVRISAIPKEWKAATQVIGNASLP